MEIHINAILVKPIYTLDGTQWYSNDAHHLRDLKPFLVLYLFCAHRVTSPIIERNLQLLEI